MLGLLWYLQRRFSRTSTRRREAETITVLGRQGLGAKAQLVMVQTADARYVLGVTEHGVSVVDRLPVAAEEGTDAVGIADSGGSVSRHPIIEGSSKPAVSGVEAFDSILAGEASASASSQTSRSSRSSADHDSGARLRVRHRNDPLRGSIISPETWRQTAEAIRRSR
ncbi:flagellar biosynthetic protein FliO [Microbacterium murale]|uniref:Flagellar protein n=1 Tax=Microbacterium murale TaxID=1081040 RepID=A0ABQ1RMR9_9MICO|nr:flagellar biosynthetic protein FliO [Microbacterium murale]GGD75142.1 hypothetical protein GCM10007269_17750 [Microbacterium murale]